MLQIRFISSDSRTICYTFLLGKDVAQGVLKLSLEVGHRLLHIGRHLVLDAVGVLLGLRLQLVAIIEGVAIAQEGAVAHFGDHRVIGQLDNYVSIGVLHLCRLSVDCHSFLFIHAFCLGLEGVHLSIFIQLNNSIYDPHTAPIGAGDITSLATVSVDKVVATAVNYAGSLSIDDNVIVASTAWSTNIQGILFTGIDVCDNLAAIGSYKDCPAVRSANDFSSSVGQISVAIVSENRLVFAPGNICS